MMDVLTVARCTCCLCCPADPLLSDVCSFLRSKLGYRPDASIVSSLFSELNRRVSGRDDVAQASASSNPALRRAAAAAAGGAADEKEMHLNTFIQVLRQAATRTSYSDHGAGLDQELEELMRSMTIMALSSDEVGEDGAPLNGLMSIKTLKHRMRVCRGDKLNDSEMASLIEFAGAYDQKGTAIHAASGHGDQGFIQYKNFVHKLALNKPAGDV
jgi:hypothetical protein